MKIKTVLILFSLSLVIAVAGCAPLNNYGYNQPFASPNTVQPNAYGLGVNADQYGRPTTYQLQNGQQLDPYIQQRCKAKRIWAGRWPRPVWEANL